MFSNIFKNRAAYDSLEEKNVIELERPQMTVRCVCLRAGYLRLRTHT